MTTDTRIEITNTCTCAVYDPDTDEFYDSVECWGDCWDMVCEDFADDISPLMQANETGWWKVTDLRLWNREQSGYFFADTSCLANENPQHTRTDTACKVATEILHKMTVDSEWTMRYKVNADTLTVEYSLSHHDAMGSNSTLSIVTADEVERLGLYA